MLDLMHDKWYNIYNPEVKIIKRNKKEKEKNKMGSMVCGTIITCVAIRLGVTTLNDDFNHNHSKMGVMCGLLGMAGFIFYLGGFIYG